MSDKRKVIPETNVAVSNVESSVGLLKDPTCILSRVRLWK